MVTAEDIHELPNTEKLRIMEILWSDLTSSTDEIESPSWHEEALVSTAERVAAGLEVPVDFAAAKLALRSERG